MGYGCPSPQGVICYPPYPPAYGVKNSTVYALFIVLLILLLIFGFWWYVDNRC